MSSQGKIAYDPRLGKHPQIVAASITFCLGFLLMRVIFGVVGIKTKPITWSFEEPIILLQTMTICCTLVHLILRREEGDFRSLFILLIGLFMAQEGFAFLSDGFGLAQFTHYSLLMSFAIIIYGSLAITSSGFDVLDEATERTRRPLLVATAGIVLLGLLRAVGAALPMQVQKLAPSYLPDVASMVLIGGMLVYMVVIQVRRQDQEDAGVLDETPLQQVKPDATTSAAGDTQSSDATPAVSSRTGDA